MYKGSTSRFKVLTILHDSDQFIVAEGEWTEPATGVMTIEVGCRWSGGDEPKDIGYPQTYGKPQWMIVRSESKDLVLERLERTISQRREDL